MSIEVICPYCQFSKTVPREKIPSGTRWVRCPRCHQRFEFIAKEKGLNFVTKEHETAAKGFERLGEESEKEFPHKGAPWENRSEIGLWKGIYDTFKGVLFSPETLFKTLTFRRGIVEPLAFGTLLGSLGTMFGLFWQFLMWSGMVFTYSEAIFGQLSIALVFFAIMVMTPFFWIIFICISSGIMHLLLLMVRGGKNGYEATLRVISYSQAAQVWSLIPFVGGTIGWIWQLVVQIIGFRHIHQTSYLRVIIAFLIPVAIIFVVGIFAVIGLIVFFGSRLG